jgi:hypothetical protein
MQTRPRRIPYAVDIRKYAGLKVNKVIPEYGKNRDEIISVKMRVGRDGTHHLSPIKPNKAGFAIG